MASIREDIVAEVASVLTGLDLGGSPTQVIQKVLREFNSVDLEGEMPIVFVLDSSERKVTGAEGAVLRTYRATVRITILIVADGGLEHRDEPMATTANRILAAVEKKLYEEGSLAGSIKAINGVDWIHTVGNQNVPFGEASGVVTVKLDVDVQYRHSDLDPSVVP